MCGSLELCTVFSVLIASMTLVRVYYNFLSGGFYAAVLTDDVKTDCTVFGSLFGVFSALY